MSDPQRLLDGELGSLARQVLDSAQLDEPDALRVTRLRHRLGLSAMAGAASVLAIAAAKASGSSSLASASGITATQATSGAAAGLLGKASMLAIAKWTGVALVPLALGATLIEAQTRHEPAAPRAVVTSGGPRSEAAKKVQQALSTVGPALPPPSTDLGTEALLQQRLEVGQEKHAIEPQPRRSDTDSQRGNSSQRTREHAPTAAREHAPTAAREHAPTAATPSAATTNSTRPAQAVEAEVARLDAARRALGRGNAALAFIELDRHAATFPRGVLLAEATVLRISALQQSGKSAEAARLGHQFLARHPSHPLATRVRSLVGEGP